PPSSKPLVPSGWSTHQTGAVRRSSAHSSTGSRVASRSGSVKSKSCDSDGADTATSWGCWLMPTALSGRGLIRSEPHHSLLCEQYLVKGVQSLFLAVCQEFAVAARGGRT